MPLSLKLTPNWGCAPDVDRSAVLYAASLASKMYDTSAKLTFGVVEKNIWGYKKLQGAPKTYKERKKSKKNQKKVATFFLFFGDSKNFVAPSPAKNPGYALGFIHIYLIKLCYE